MPLIKKIILTIFLLTGIMVSITNAQAQTTDEIISCLKTGNAKVLSRYFNQNVDLVVLDNGNVYSKAQAQQIVSNFFSTHSPESFIVLHDMPKEGAKYVIGTLKTNNGSYRVYFLLKESSGKDYIHQLRIQKQ